MKEKHIPSSEEVKKAEKKNMSNPNKWTPEQLEKQTDRLESDAKLVEEGAKYVIDKGAKDPRLDLSEGQLEHFYEEEHLRENLEKIKSGNIGLNDMVYIKMDNDEEIKGKIIELRQYVTGGPLLHSKGAVVDYESEEYKEEYKKHIADNTVIYGVEIMNEQGKIEKLQFKHIKVMNKIP